MLQNTTLIVSVVKLVQGKRLKIRQMVKGQNLNEFPIWNLGSSHNIIIYKYSMFFS